MHEAVTTLLRQERPVEVPVWRSFWERLREGGLRRGESVALLASLATRLPDRITLTGFLDSLAENQPAGVPEDIGAAVNIVGTGGGPRTFNISTAAAMVAAAMGVRVVKTGSRAYTGALGSVDLLERLGIPLTASYEETHASLETHGIAFTGAFVYPAELGLLTRSVLPLDIRQLGGFVNALGPFLARLPARAQLTGVADRRLVTGLRHAAGYLARGGTRSVWLCVNGAGADELLSFLPNRVYTREGALEDEFVLDPARLGLRPGSIDELRPPDGDPVACFREVLSGRGTPVAEETVALNAAALAVAGQVTGDWNAALEAARAAIRDGRALDLLSRLRSGAAVHA
ncbi:anthranilate phosphoribosyltransferase [Streptomyces sp. LaBMicrA B280]|uniref:anthranilate phosphoribosyltransferase n=1 Tax=Streptomyces sp. LaBMicrA B280 TaxID=3391001 RepID=UPI003BA4C79D